MTSKGGTDSGLDIYCLSWSNVDDDLGGTHWYLRDGESGPFEMGTRRAFITGYEPSNRTAGVLEALNIDH